MPRDPPWFPDLAQDARPPTLAQDDASVAALSWVNMAMSSALAEGTTFLGYAELSVMAQRAEYRVMSETIASEMTREWIEIKSTGEADKTARIRELTDFLDYISAREGCRTSAMYDGLFGRGHLYLDTGQTDDPAELKTPLGDGRNKLSMMKIGPKRPRKNDEPVVHQLEKVKPVEPVWCYPTNYNSNNPLKSDWYNPTNWFVMSNQLHVSRLLTFIGRPVPDMLKPAYSFGGLSMTQMAKPYVDNWLKIRQAVADQVVKYSANVYKSPNLMGASLALGGDEFFRRVDFMNAVRDNNGAIVLGTDEEWLNVSTPLATLDQIQAQAQEHMASVSRIPLVKLLGIQPAGLNASSDGEIRSFYDWIHAFQEVLFRAPLTTIMGFSMLSLWGKIDPDITFDFKSLWQLDDAAKAGVQKTRADTREVDIAAGVIKPEEGRLAAAADPDSQYAGLDLAATPAPEPPDTDLDGDPDAPEAGPGLNPSHRDIAGGIMSHAMSASQGGFSGDEKLQKPDVSFEHPAAGQHHCSECRHFEHPAACALVAGDVAPEDWCELWDTKS